MSSLRDEVERVRAAAKVQQQARSRDRRYSRSARAQADLGSTVRFLYQIGAGLSWAWRHTVVPLYRLYLRVSGSLWRFYRRYLWTPAVYRRDADGTLLFTKWRAGAMVLASIAFLCLMPLLVDCAWDAAVYAATVQHDEHIYLLGSQEIDPWTGGHNVEGCSHLPCSDQDAMYFRTAGGLFNNLWSLTHGRGLFYPEYVGAAVPYQMSRCVVTSYGWRFRFPFRLINTYSYLLAVTCKPAATGE